MNRNFLNSNNQYNKRHENENQNLSSFMKRPPTAWASVRGNEHYPTVKGTVRFYQMKKGVLVVSEFDGLPQSDSPCESPVFAFHIHNGTSCGSGEVQQPNGNGEVQQPNGNGEVQQPNGNGEVQQPNGNGEVQQPNGNGGVQQPNGNSGVQQPNGNGQLPGGNDNVQPPTENDIIPPNNIPNTFPNAGTHYNPFECPHPYHAGDMPPLFGANGYAFLTFVTSRFTVNDIVGKTIIVHSKPDDFSTQPSGNAGEKIACGVIVSI